MRPFRFAIIGTSGIAEMHWRCLQAEEGAEVVCFLASTPERARRAATKFGLPVYSLFEDMVSHHDLDAVSICTASGNHLEPTIRCVQHGLHVICEKPLEITVSRGREMVRAAKHAGVILAGIFQNRFNPNFQRLKLAVHRDDFGTLLKGSAYINWYRDQSYYAESPWKGTLKGDGGAALINQGIHTIDLLLQIMGEPVKVFAKTQTRIHDIEGEDLASAIITFENGAIGVIEGSTALYPGYPERLEIFGSKGSAILSGGTIVAWHEKGVSEDDKHESHSEKMGSGSSDPTGIEATLHKAQFQNFVAAIAGTTEPAVTGNDMLQALNLIEHIYLSSNEGREVDINPL